MPFCCKCGLKVADADGFCTGCGIRLVNPQWIGEQRRAEEARARTAKTRAYLQTSSISWFVVAAISFILPSVFSAGWGVVCVILGVLNLAFPYRSMLIVSGIGMMLEPAYRVARPSDGIVLTQAVTVFGKHYDPGRFAAPAGGRLAVTPAGRKREHVRV